jgi:hypothetical protein
MTLAGLFPAEGEGSGPYPGAKKIRQGINDYHRGPPPGLKQRRRPGHKIGQNRFPRLGGNIGEDKIPGGAGRARKEGFRMGGKLGRGKAV